MLIDLFTVKIDRLNYNAQPKKKSMLFPPVKIVFVHASGKGWRWGVFLNDETSISSMMLTELSMINLRTVTYSEMSTS